MDLGLRGRTVLITGGSQGVGLATAEKFAYEGVANIHLAARSRDNLEAAKRLLTSKYPVEVKVHSVDLSTPNGVEALSEVCCDVDILFNNAADTAAGSLDQVDDEQWKESMNVKIGGYVLLTKACYKVMKKKKRGVVINNIGIAGENWDANYIVGTTVNSAMMGFTKGVGGKSLEDGVRVVGINPGLVETDRIIKLMKHRAKLLYGDSSKWKELFQNLPRNRPAMPDEIADAVVWLASDRASYISGTIITIDGGLSARGSIV